MSTVRICHGEPHNLVGKVLVLTTGKVIKKIKILKPAIQHHIYHEVGERSRYSYFCFLQKQVNIDHVMFSLLYFISFADPYKEGYVINSICRLAGFGLSVCYGFIFVCISAISMETSDFILKVIQE